MATPVHEACALAGRLFHLLFYCCLLAMVSGTMAKPFLQSNGAREQSSTHHQDKSIIAKNHKVTTAISAEESRHFWPESDDVGLKPLFTEEDRASLAKKMRKLKVVSLEAGCGRMKNRLATLEDGTRVCCRYRENGNQLRGDLYAYHFNRLLGMWNIPATLAVKLELKGKTWRNVSGAAKEAGWSDGVSIIVSQYVEGLEEEHFPTDLLNASETKPLTATVSSSTDDVKRLMEWTDMIVFDYVIGHNDRLFNALLNSRWNSHMMEKPVHNLKKTSSSSDLVLLDNESGFEFGYTVAEQKEEYRQIQIYFLERICVFRSPTISALSLLGKGDKNTPLASAQLENYIRRVDLPSFAAVRQWKAQSKAEFDRRVNRTLERVHGCAHQLINR